MRRVVAQKFFHGGKLAGRLLLLFSRVRLLLLFERSEFGKSFHGNSQEVF